MNKSLDFYSMVIISNYFENILNFVNITKTCKKYEPIISTFKYNPIPTITPELGIMFYQQLKNPLLKLTYKLFNNIDTLHIHNKLNINQIIKIASKYFKIIYWPPISYSLIYNNNEYLKNVEFKNVYSDDDFLSKIKNNNIIDFNEYESLIKCKITELTGKFSEYSKVKKIILSNNIYMINDKCFAFSNINEIIFSNSLVKIGNNAFSHCYNLKSIILPNSVKEIGEYCFFNLCGLEEIKLSDSLTKIPNYCFKECYNLKLIKIPKNIIEIGNYVFNKCPNLKIKFYKDKIKNINIHEFTFHDMANDIINNYEEYKHIVHSNYYITGLFPLSTIINLLNISYIDDNDEFNNDK